MFSACKEVTETTGLPFSLFVTYQEFVLWVRSCFIREKVDCIS